MKKLFFTLAFLFGIISTSQSSQNVESLEISNCTAFANLVASYVDQNGGNYYEAWFSAFGDCVSRNPVQI